MQDTAVDAATTFEIGRDKPHNRAMAAAAAAERAGAELIGFVMKETSGERERAEPLGALSRLDQLKSIQADLDKRCGPDNATCSGSWIWRPRKGYAPPLERVEIIIERKGRFQATRRRNRTVGSPHGGRSSILLFGWPVTMRLMMSVR